MRQTIRRFLKGQVLKRLAEPALVAVLMACATTAIAQPFYVPSGSMEPTLRIGDAFIASKYPYGFSRWSLPYGLGPASQARLFGAMPRHGDVVVFRAPGNPRVTLVKRVIGLPGDRIAMRAGRLVINGAALPLTPAGLGQVENHDGSKAPVAQFIEELPGGARHPIFKWQANGPLDTMATRTVPSGHVFVMGDNRDNSLDSRVPLAEGGVGMVPVENLMGRAEMVVGSYDFLAVHSVHDWLGQFRLSRFLHAL